jgi:hypothetical protein
LWEPGAKLLPEEVTLPDKGFVKSACGVVFLDAVQQDSASQEGAAKPETANIVSQMRSIDINKNYTITNQRGKRN